MPVLGLGTWTMTDEAAAKTVPVAAQLGYRMVDSAAFYQNERGVGEGIRRSGLPREDFFVTSKVNGRDQGFDHTLRGCEQTLSRLGTDYLDLYLIHWPMPMRGLYVDTWRAFIRLVEEGYVRSIGVSNFLPTHLDRIRDETGIVPAVNQIQLHPRIVQQDSRAYAEKQGIVVQSWSPLGQGGKLLSEPVVQKIAERHSKSTAQTILRWHLEQGLVPIPKSADRDRLADNLDVFGFHLTDEEIEEITRLNGSEKPMDPETFEQD
ncbi:aldo/keto reductase [Streptomyces mirabilis]|uniref:aldo/keto reductase n=1 Tax=Streptomyces mirabilis TaxID=68239 RepID=UPI0036463AC1